MNTSIILPRTFLVDGYKVTANIKFELWDNMGGNRSYRASPAEVAKVLKALVKATGAKVNSVRSKSYSMGSNVEIFVDPTNLTEDKKLEIEKIAKVFQRGKYNSMKDIYEYSDSPIRVPDPGNVDEIEFTVKYVFVNFVTLENF